MTNTPKRDAILAALKNYDGAEKEWREEVHFRDGRNLPAAQAAMLDAWSALLDRINEVEA